MILAAATAAAAQSTLLVADKTIPFEEGFRIYLVPDMEGMGSAVLVTEVIAGNEAPRYRDRTGPDYWNHYRQLLTQEANVVIEGARAAGARSFVVNEGHGGNRFANITHAPARKRRLLDCYARVQGRTGWQCCAGQIANAAVRQFVHGVNGDDAGC